jgi:hypothetical protein
MDITSELATIQDSGGVSSTSGVSADGSPVIGFEAIGTDSLEARAKGRRKGKLEMIIETSEIQTVA